MSSHSISNDEAKQHGGPPMDDEIIQRLGSALESLTTEELIHVLESAEVGELIHVLESVEVVDDEIDSQKEDGEKRPLIEVVADHLMFDDPPPREECPLCLTTLPLEDDKVTYTACCGKTICSACNYGQEMVFCLKNARKSDEEPYEAPSCPFCRAECPTRAEYIRRLERRVEKDDPVAMRILAEMYMGRGGGRDLSVDESKGLELYHRAADLGETVSSFFLSQAYLRGDLGLSRDYTTGISHLAIAAMYGHVHARHCLGSWEYSINGAKDRAAKHWRISAAAGLKASADKLIKCYQEGVINKAELEESLRAKHEACENMRTEGRDEHIKFMKYMKSLHLSDSEKERIQEEFLKRLGKT